MNVATGQKVWGSFGTTVENIVCEATVEAVGHGIVTVAFGGVVMVAASENVYANRAAAQAAHDALVSLVGAAAVQAQQNELYS